MSTGDAEDDRSVVQESFDQFSKKQLQIYAAELNQHYHEERRLRRELENRNRELAQKVKELLSLNNLFQKFLALNFDRGQSDLSLSSASELVLGESSDADPEAGRIDKQ